MAEITKACECCGKPMQVRSADVKRGWGRFCSKSCKASEQARRTGQYRALNALPRHDGFSEMAHKDCAECGNKAVNGVRDDLGRVTWYCATHMVEAMTHPFSDEAFQS